MYLLGRKAQNQQEDDSSYKGAKVAEQPELRIAIGPLSGRSLKYCADATLRRYLVARNWNVDKSKKMMEESLKWSSSYKLEEIKWLEVAHEDETGKVSRANFHDKLGRTVLIMRPGMQNTTSPENNIRHLVYLMENAILNLPEARDISYILQNHYPERLAVAFLYNPPKIFQAFVKAVKYFLDPKTAQKVKFVYPNDKDSAELMKSLFDIENLPIEFGGKATLKYDHEGFSRMMAEDDVKTAKFWGIDEKPFHTNNVQSGTEVAIEPVIV